MSEEVEHLANQIAKRTGSELDFPLGLVKTEVTTTTWPRGEYPSIVNNFKVGIGAASALSVGAVMHSQDIMQFNPLIDLGSMLTLGAVVPITASLIFLFGNANSEGELLRILKKLVNPLSDYYYYENKELNSTIIKTPSSWSSLNLLRIFKKVKLAEHLRYDAMKDEYRVITHLGSYYKMTQKESVFLGERGVFAKARQEIGEIG